MRRRTILLWAALATFALAGVTACDKTPPATNGNYTVPANDESDGCDSTPPKPGGTRPTTQPCR